MLQTRSAAAIWRPGRPSLADTFLLGLADALEVSPASWPDTYVNRDTGKVYTSHGSHEDLFVRHDTPRWVLEKGGEGSGKSASGIVKTLERARRGCDGIMVGPDLPHFRRSLWQEFRRWCPWEQVVPRQRYRQNKEWEPNEPFVLAFLSGARLFCGGIESPGSWEGPNVNFAFMDEARHLRNAGALKVLAGRTRIPGPHGEPPQVFITTTPRKNWLFEYFGPWDDPAQPDPHADFKAEALVVTLRTADNAANLDADYIEKRGQSLTDQERRVLMDAEWEDIDNGQRFLEDMLWWDACVEQLPPLGPREALVLAMDAGVSNDCFAIVGVTRHPARPADVAVRLVHVWEPKGQKLDFAGPEQYVRNLCKQYNVKCVTYDPYQLHDMATRLYRERVAWFDEFQQGAPRLEADKQLLDLILAKRLAHDGNPTLRQHVQNADRAFDAETRKLRIVKREMSLKIDACVAASMATYKSLALRLS